MKRSNVYYYENTEIKELKDKEHAVLSKKAINLGIDLAGRNLPEGDSQSVQPFIGSIKQGYQSLIQKCKSILTPEVQGEQLDIEEDDFLKAASQLEKEIATVENDLRIKESEHAKADTTLQQKEKRWMWRGRPITGLIVLSDIALSVMAMEVLRYPKWVSILISVCIGASILLICHYFPSIIKVGKTPAKRKRNTIMVLAGTFLLFLGLGFLRSMAIPNASLLHILTFTIINYVFFLAAFAAVYFMKPTPEEYKIIDQYKQLEKEVKDIQKKRKDLKSQQQTLQAEFREKEDLRKRIIQFAQDIEQEINMLWEMTYNDFVQANIFHRQDGKIPKILEDKPEPLSMYHQPK